MMPEYRPNWIINKIKSKSGVCMPGCRYSDSAPALSPPSDSPPLIIWNHRWEFDKNPKDFFDVLDAVKKQGHNFRIALLGENYQVEPKEFNAAKMRFGDRIVQYGFIETKEKYIDWLKRGSIVISTAAQENFGISIVEAIRFGCLPLVPNRLSYPEIIPKTFHKDFIYSDLNNLTTKLAHLVENLSQFQTQRQSLSDAMGKFAWKNRINAFDGEFENLVSMI